MRRTTHAFRALVAGAAVAAAAWAAPVKIFRAQNAADFGKGEPDGVAIDASGVLRLAPRAVEVASLEEPFALALAPWGDGWAVGTGNEGRVLRVSRDGEVSTLFDAEETEVFALWPDSKDRLVVGTSPEGKIWEIGRDGAATELFDPDGAYVWGLARGGDGALWVATGSPGRLYRKAGDAEPEIVWEGGAHHVRTLLPQADGSLLFGTAGDGRVLRWKDGALRTLFDSELTEVVALDRAANGDLWIALLSSEASFVDLTPRPSNPSSSSSSSAEGSDPQPVVTVDEGFMIGSRAPGSRGPRSELWRRLASGALERVWSSTDETIFDLWADGDRLWFGTGLDGRLYLLEGGRARVVKRFDAKQIVALAPGQDGPVALTTNGAALWRFDGGREAAGTYTGPALDAGQLARFGVFRWQGDLPRGAALAASFRSGFSSEPDETWSDWSAPAEGDEIPLAGLDPGRFVQYRLELSGGKGEGPRVVATELSYRQENLRPEIDSFGALDPGQILVPAGFNPTDQLFEPTSPNREGIFETLTPVAPRDERTKAVFKKGWRTLRWSASDPNGDDLRFRLEVRPEGDADGWIELADDLSGTSWPFDATALPDGLYRFRLSASDEPGQGRSGSGLVATRESDAVTVDHSPPELLGVERRKGVLVAKVRDLASPLRSAEFSIDGAEWEDAQVEDGLLDGRGEAVVIDGIAADARLVLLRLTDASFNVKTFDLGSAGR